VGSDEEVRQRVIDAAAELFAEHGYEGVGVRQVAQRAGVSQYKVRTLTGGRAELFAAVIAEKVSSAAADWIARAVEAPGELPPLAAVVEAAAAVFADPARSWDVLELEALTRAHRDEQLRAIESERIQRRWDNMRTVVRRVRDAGGVDADVDDDALAHFALALSVGLAMLDPVVSRKPTPLAWNALMARIDTAVSPPNMLLRADHEALVPWRVRVDIPDRPGGVDRLIRALAALHTYTVGLYVIGTGDGVRTVDVALKAPEGVTEATLRTAALSAGRNAHVKPGSPEDALDLPTRLLDASTELVANPGWAPFAARDLIEADHVQVLDATAGEQDSANVLRLQWTTDRHVLLSRGWAPFARAEQTRASALLRLCAALAAASGDADAVGWVEPVRSGTVWIRLAHPEDAQAVAAMHRRCSDRTLYLRYVSRGDWQEIQMRRLAGGHSGATLVAIGDDGDVIGLANVFPERPGDEHTAEIALLVEDAHQGAGIGSALLRRMIRLADRLGFAEVVAMVLVENRGMLSLLERTGLRWSTTFDSGMATMRAPLAGQEAAPPPAG
jgi:AcrR family transcriptional regulator/L-amino acid N-acyltransferase YncA